MLSLLPMLFVMQGVAAQPDLNIKLRERINGPTPVTDKDLRPAKLPDCRTAAEVQITIEQIRNGDPELCFIRDKTAFRTQ
jgi:hypothetical protein